MKRSNAIIDWPLMMAQLGEAATEETASVHEEMMSAEPLPKKMRTAAKSCSAQPLPKKMPKGKAAPVTVKEEEEDKGCPSHEGKARQRKGKDKDKGQGTRDAPVTVKEEEEEEEEKDEEDGGGRIIRPNLMEDEEKDEEEEEEPRFGWKEWSTCERLAGCRMRSIEP